MPCRTPHRLVALAYDGVQSLDLVGPVDVFDAATRLQDRVSYDVVVASPRGGRVTAATGICFDTVPTAEIGELDTLLVPGSLDRGLPEDRAGLVAEIVRLSATAERVVSVCTGAFLLAAAGVLDDRRATTHWSACDDLATEHPRVTVEPDRIFVRDGDVWTAGGVAAGMDLALAMVADDLGDAVARAAAKWLLIFLQRPGGQSQFSARSRLPVIDSPQIRRSVDAITADPSGDHSVAHLADIAGVSRRHFARLFREQTGITPGRYVEATRVESACSLLEGTAVGLEAVAGAAGFGSAESMRQAFQRVLGVAPGEYRSRFTGGA